MGAKVITSSALLLAGLALLSQVALTSAVPATLNVTWVNPPTVPILEVPPGRTWDFANATLSVCKGDSVHFRWNCPMPHGLSTVSSASKYNDCDLTGAKILAKVATTGNVMQTMTSTGTKYYVCQATGHCQNHHKMKVVVGEAC